MNMSINYATFLEQPVKTDKKTGQEPRRLVDEIDSSVTALSQNRLARDSACRTDDADVIDAN